MASPDDPDATVGADEARAAPLSGTPVDLPVYRPRRRVVRYFWMAFLVAAIIAGALVWLLLV